MKYKCLILDHDDTIVNSTEGVNYVSFKQVLEKIRPGVKLSLDDFFRFNFEPGFISLCYDILEFSKEEMGYQVEYWQDYISKHSPELFEGEKNFFGTL